MMMVSYVTSTSSFHNICYNNNNKKPQIPGHSCPIVRLPVGRPMAQTTTRSVEVVTRRALSLLTTLTATAAATTSLFSFPVLAATPKFTELADSGGVKALELRIGDGDSPRNGDQVAIHYYGRLAAKQGWRFDSTYDHKDQTGEPLPFVFTLGSGKVIAGIETAVKTMKVGGIRRVIIPPSQGYQNMEQEPIPPDFFDRQRLFTTIFNPTRLANGEGSTLGIIIFDIELVTVKHV